MKIIGNYETGLADMKMIGNFENGLNAGPKHMQEQYKKIYYNTITKSIHVFSNGIWIDTALFDNI